MVNMLYQATYSSRSTLVTDTQNTLQRGHNSNRGATKWANHMICPSPACTHPEWRQPYVLAATREHAPTSHYHKSARACDLLIWTLISHQLDERARHDNGEYTKQW